MTRFHDGVSGQEHHAPGGNPPAAPGRCHPAARAVRHWHPWVHRGRVPTIF